MTYAEAIAEWVAAHPNAQRTPDHARSHLADGTWHMASADGTHLGLIDDRTGRSTLETKL